MELKNLLSSSILGTPGLGLDKSVERLTKERLHLDPDALQVEGFLPITGKSKNSSGLTVAQEIIQGPNGPILQQRTIRLVNGKLVQRLPLDY